PGPVGRSQPHTRIEVRVRVLAVRADQFDSRLVVRVFAQVVVGQQFEADSSGGGHLVFRVKLNPLAAYADAITLILIRTADVWDIAGRPVKSNITVTTNTGVNRGICR